MMLLVAVHLSRQIWPPSRVELGEMKAEKAGKGDGSMEMGVNRDKLKGDSHSTHALK